MKRILVPMMVAALAVFSAFTLMHEDLDAAMQKMMQKMKSMKMSGDPDKDFAMMMIEHHQGAIDAANIVVKSGKDQKIKELAQKTLKIQPQDQTELRKYTTGKNEGHSANNNDSASSHSSQFTSDMNNLVNEMETKMKSMKMSGDIDHDFATMMIDHHQAAIDLADIETQHGQMNEVKSLAEKIKKDSQKDISELQSWLNVHAKK